MGTIARGAKAGGGTDFNSGQTIDPAENNTDHNTMYSEFNGNIENVNIKAAAAIATSKIAHSGARVYNSGAISTTTGTVTLLTFDSEHYDTDTYHSTSSNTGRLTAPTTGYYLISALAQFAAESSAAVHVKRLIIRLNAAGSGAGGTKIAESSIDVGAYASAMDLNVTTVYALTAADYVECFAQQDSGETLDVQVTGNHTPEFAIVRLGA